MVVRKLSKTQGVEDLSWWSQVPWTRPVSQVLAWACIAEEVMVFVADHINFCRQHRPDPLCACFPTMHLNRRDTDRGNS